ncbi:hypothetical protein fugu_003396 [Takifugu bimaculatus]|uniref:Uncharacterized protein n=1 Tax=Takifugu bimaculatus TaxID=433685 RepID=A0A4Z2BH86_9TELE|nr:hypothetical protein fugu_003396 [Takifugu bimaculatus]
MFPARRTPTEPLAGHGAPFLGYARVELPLPLRPITIHPPTFSPPYNIRALKNTLLDTHEPPVSFPGPGETHTFVRKPCFFCPRLRLLATASSAERIAAASARFLSPSHEEERTDADVNTGNHTNTDEPEKKPRKQSGGNEATCTERS